MNDLPLRERSDSALGYEPADTTPSQEELERWSAFHEAVVELPVAEREVIGLTFYHGWTQMQIAELLQISDRQVRRLWKSACAQLMTRLGGDLPNWFSHS
jgi:RNA polymerase sigma factor (sigma-70 family)